jgi:hypothetical protein
MQSQSASSDRRCSSDRRIADKDFPPDKERRIHAERRGFEVVEFHFDEEITLERADQWKTVLG